jgi:hypothetical protein
LLTAPGEHKEDQKRLRLALAAYGKRPTMYRLAQPASAKRKLGTR